MAEILSSRFLLAQVNKSVYSWGVKSSEFKRWLEKQGAILAPGKGSHFHVTFNGRTSVLPMHSKELGKGLVAAIKKQLGLK